MFHEGSASKENMASLRRDTKHSLAEAEHQTRPRRGGTPNTASQRRNTTKEGWLKKLRKTLIKNTTRLLKRFHGFASSWNLLNQRTKRCCVCRDFTAARCDKQATNYAWLGRFSKTARVTLKITKHEIPRKSSRTRAETNKEER